MPEHGDTIGRVVEEGQGTFLWQIPEFSGLPKEEEEIVLRGPVIHLAGTEWSLMMLPNGEEDFSRQMVLGVWRHDEGPAFQCTVGVRLADGGEEPVGGQTVKIGAGYAQCVIFPFHKRAEECVEGGFLSSDTLTIILRLTEEGEAMSPVSTPSPASRVITPKHGDEIGRVVEEGATLWQIPEFSGLPKEEGINFLSPFFNLAGTTRWKLTLYPNGVKDLSHRILLGVSRLDDGPAFRCAVGVRRADGGEEQVGRQAVMFGSGYVRHVFYRFHKRAEEGEFLSCDTLTLTLRIAEENAASRVVTLSQNLKDLYMSGEGCDVKFKVNNKSFSAHRIILRARSPVFMAMLTENCLESDTRVISVEDCNPESFEIFLIFLYSGTTENLTTENVMSVYYIADKYQVPDLKSQCVLYIVSNLTIYNICDVLCLALKVNDKFLLQESSKFFLQNGKEIFSTSEWETFMVENTSQAKDLIIKYADAH